MVPKDVKKPEAPAPRKTLKIVTDEEKKKTEPIKEAKEEDEAEKTKKALKPKPIMVDAWTQTERSDYSIIKSRMLSHQQYASTLITK